MERRIGFKTRDVCDYWLPTYFIYLLCTYEDWRLFIVEKINAKIKSLTFIFSDKKVNIVCTLG